MTAREYMARKLQYLRKRSGLTVNEVGEAVGKSGKTVSAWEVGRGQPDADMLVTLCHLFDARISDFFVPEVSREHTLDANESSLVEIYRNADESGKTALRPFLFPRFTGRVSAGSCCVS